MENNKKTIKSKVDANGKKLKVKVNRDVAKVLNKNSMARNNILALNPYLDSLLRPDEVHGAKIPDVVMFPSATFEVVDRRSLTVNGNGFCGISYGVGGQTSAIAQGSLTPIPNVSAPTSYAVGMIMGSASDNTNIYQSTSPGTYITLPNWGATTDQIPKTFEKVRLVSVGVEAQYTGAPLNTKGTLTLAMAPRNSIRGLIAGGGVTLDRIRQIPGARVLAVNRLEGGRVLFKPQDSLSLAYTDQDFVPGSAYTAQDWLANVQCVSAAGAELFLIFDGCAVGDTVITTAYFNFEAIPRLNTSNIVNASPSASDPLALSQAMNSIQETPSTIAKSFQDTTRSFLSQASAMRVHEKSEHKNSSVMDKVLKGIGSFGSVLKVGLPILQDIMGAL